MSLSENGRSWFRSNRLYPYDFHESASAFGVDGITLSTKKICHLATAFGWMTQMLLVDDSHDLKILRALKARLIVNVGSMQSQQLALLSDTDLAIIEIDPGTLLSHRLGPLFF